MVSQKIDLRTGKSLWRNYTVPRVPFSKLKSDIKTDVVIIGAGITGAMAAEEISSIGLKVIMLDRRGPMKGATSATTALLQYEIDTPLMKLREQIGQEKAMRAWRRSKLGLESLAAKIQSLNIDCDFKRIDSLYLSGKATAEDLKLEFELRNNIGLHTDYYTRKRLFDEHQIRRSAALKSFDNLSVNPLKMTAGFLQKAIQNRVEVFAPVSAEDVQYDNNKVRVVTKDGFMITAKYLIYATGFEIPKVIHSKKHSIHSTYAITTKPQPSKLWPGRCFIWEASDPYLYLRTTDDGRIICGGEDEEFKDEESRDKLLERKTKILEKKLKHMFPEVDSTAEFAWCGSFGASRTGLPTIGEIPKMPNCFAIMAFGGNGITFSRIAAEIIKAELSGKSDPDADLYAFS